ncbi:MAG: L-lysine 6-transaminase [Ignavibacteriaceae bacterium]|nr:L-lysine 6-transaminase [Ignavibacteriaceae bacterium]
MLSPDINSSTDKKILTNSSINADQVHTILKRYMLVDGFDIILDLKRSHGSFIVDEKTGDEYLDFFTFFASNPLGMNHPKVNEPEFLEKLRIASIQKPSNSDIYTDLMAEFVNNFGLIAKPDTFKYLFFVEGGSVGVENGLKVAFDWKVKKNFRKGYKDEKGTQVIHFRDAFHGRTGYTLSLTNTDPAKIQHFPKFNWPRISNPKVRFPIEDHLAEIIQSENQALEEIKNAIRNNPDDIAVLIIEPVQAEGGDHFFRKEFFINLRQICDENEILLMFDEVQTGLGITGKMWAHEHYVTPDIVSFGKKVQLGGIMAGSRIDEIEDNCFRVSSRINSTWGGNLTDMVRGARILEVIHQDRLVDNAAKQGKILLEELNHLQTEFPGIVSNSRGLGLMCAFDFQDADTRKKFLTEVYRNKLLILSCGKTSVRFRTALNINTDDLKKGIGIIRNSLYNLSKSNN